MSALDEFNVADAIGFWIALRVKPSDREFIHKCLLSYSSAFVAGLDLGLSRTILTPPRGRLIYRLLDSEDIPDEVKRTVRTRPDRSGFSLSRSRSL